MTMTSLETLKRYFGYSVFRGGQETLINSILSGQDVLGIMPTGAGKSICFQIPSLMMDGIALIVSPLISLMKDQVNALTHSGVAAAYINSSLTPGQIDRALRNAVNGAYKLIYVAPERLTTFDFMAFVRSANISMLAVDEAHCISQWGQDFRPSYAGIPNFIAMLPKRPIVSAFTATATPKVREDIVTLLGLSAPQILITGFDRKNLYFGVNKPRNKYDALTAFLSDKRERSGIIYCGTRKNVEFVCKRLRTGGYSASRYHAGLSDKERHDNQDDFLYDRVQIMVATNAFGMGIDKSNVSFVVHFNMPKDIESYYQEAGRAGRDGEPADCLLLYSSQDIRMNEWMIENDKDIRYPDKATEAMLKERSRQRLREMVFYCTTPDCLRGSILKYFGEIPPDYCGNCGSCDTDDVSGKDADAETARGGKRGRIGKKTLNRLSNKPVGKHIKKPKDEKLFELLKNVRRQIAKEESVPAFIIFSDGSLADMCAKLPKTGKGFLRVSGVGDIKLQRYGERFLKVIKEYLQKKNPGGNGAGKAAAAKKASKVGETKPAKKTGGAPHGKPKTTDAANSVKITDKPVPVSMIAERINGYTASHGVRKKISAAGINEWLVSEGYIDTINDNGKNRKISTDKGNSIGILTAVRKVGSERVRINMFGRTAQELVIEKFCGYRNDINIESAGGSTAPTESS